MAVRPSQRDDACIAGASTADVLRLLSAGAAGAILMALGEGPLRTKTLIEQVPGYARRTIYRYAGKLTELEVVEREEEPGVPSHVVYTLSDPCGSELYALVNRFADASLTRLPDGRVDAHAWAALGQLAEMWETGMVEALGCEPLSPTELARSSHGLSYHQVNRRAGLFKAAGLLDESEGPSRRRRYGLTAKTRRKMGLLAGIARWRHRHVVAEDEEGMTVAEMATVLRTTLPLVRFSEHRGKRMELAVLDRPAAAGSGGATIRADVTDDGTVRIGASPPGEPDSRGAGEVGDWLSLLLDGDNAGLKASGDTRFVEDSLGELSRVLWRPQAD